MAKAKTATKKAVGTEGAREGGQSGGGPAEEARTRAKKNVYFFGGGKADGDGR